MSIKEVNVQEYSKWFTFRKSKHIENSIRDAHLNIHSVTRYAFLVDRGHRNGKEVHLILEDATIVILNYGTRILITYLFARPNQIRRYFKETPKQAEDILRNAFRNIEQGRNSI